MCGRYSLFTPPTDLEARFDATFEEGFEPRYNAAPRQSLPVIASDAPERFRRMEWGLVPSWADDRSEFGFVNARAETVTEKSSFREAYEHRPCLVPADGFYEWTETSGGKRPFRVTLTDERPFAMAGLWERWEPPQRQTGLGEFGGAGPDEDVVVETFTVVTTEPNEAVANLHDRMAVILDPEEETTWLRGDPDERRALLNPYDGELAVRPVSRTVNDPSNDSPRVLRPAAE